MGLYSLDQIASLGSALQELFVDAELIHDITTDLTRNEDAVHGTGFQKYYVNQTVFGDSSVGGSLGYHHSLAHQTVSDTLAAVLSDLQTFRQGLQTFAKAVDSADTQSAADLQKRNDAVAALAQSAGFTHTHSLENYFHPHHHTGGTDA
jgi:hypothetical protein